MTREERFKNNLNALIKKRERDKEYQKNKRARLIGYKTKEYREWCRKNPEKAKAQQLLNKAVRRGIIQKSPCVECGATHRIEGHHQDYLKPYEVIWLCTLHHKTKHKLKILCEQKQKK